MYREPHAERNDKKVWLSTEEVEQFLVGIEDTDRRLVFGLGLRSGLRPGESIEITPEDVGRGPQGWMLHVPEPTAKNSKYRETPLPRELATTIRTVDDVRQEPSDAPLVDVSTRTLRRWVKQRGDDLAAETGREGWRDLRGPRARHSLCRLSERRSSVHRRHRRM